jgi:hypothetical protein
VNGLLKETSRKMIKRIGKIKKKENIRSANYNNISYNNKKKKHNKIRNNLSSCSEVCSLTFLKEREIGSQNDRNVVLQFQRRSFHTE